MIYDTLSNVNTYAALSPRLRKALEYLASTDFSQVADGRYELEGDALFVNVMSVTTNPAPQREASVWRPTTSIWTCSISLPERRSSAWPPGRPWGRASPARATSASSPAPAPTSPWAGGSSWWYGPRTPMPPAWPWMRRPPSAGLWQRSESRIKKRPPDAVHPGAAF